MYGQFLALEAHWVLKLVLYACKSNLLPNKYAEVYVGIPTRLLLNCLINTTIRCTNTFEISIDQNNTIRFMYELVSPIIRYKRYITRLSFDMWLYRKPFFLQSVSMESRNALNCQSLRKRLISLQVRQWIEFEYL